MARITVENCGSENLFSLVLKAARRARELQNGEQAMVDPEDDKCTVVALREIESGYDVSTKRFMDSID